MEHQDSPFLTMKFCEKRFPIIYTNLYHLAGNARLMSCTIAPSTAWGFLGTRVHHLPLRVLHVRLDSPSCPSECSSDLPPTAPLRSKTKSTLCGVVRARFQAPFSSFSLPTPPPHPHFHSHNYHVLPLLIPKRGGARGTYTLLLRARRASIQEIDCPAV